MAGTETHYTLPLPAFDKPVKLLVVVAPYYKDIADNLVAGAKAVGAACGAEVEVGEFLDLHDSLVPGKTPCGAGRRFDWMSVCYLAPIWRHGRRARRRACGRSSPTRCRTRPAP